MIQLAQEIPTSMLREWTPLSDLDFILAHKVLEDAEYAEFFKGRATDRELILDNSYHELGYPLPLSDLLEAAQRCRADYVIAPDKVGDVHENAKAYLDARSVLTGYKIAVVMTGTPGGGDEFHFVQERESFLYEVRDADMLCCTFKEPTRLNWFQRSWHAKRWKRVHLLGVSELAELKEWNREARFQFHVHGRRIRWSVDTGKALKWALRGKNLLDLESLRSDASATTLGQPSVASQHILGVSRDEAMKVDLLFRNNVQVLKDTCR